MSLAINQRFERRYSHFEQSAFLLRDVVGTDLSLIWVQAPDVTQGFVRE